jgi:uncharacterized protein DUF6457
MGEWIDELAAAVGHPPLEGSETAALLQVSREVAHRVERKVTPLAAFLIGLDVAGRMAAGESRGAAIAASIAKVERLLPEPKPDGG